MNDNEQQIYNLISNKIKEKYSGVIVNDQKLSNNLLKYPAVSIVQTNNAVLSQYSTFDQLENVCNEIFEFEVADSFESGMIDIKAILSIINSEMKRFGYLRTQLGLIENQETQDIRRLAKYEKQIIK